MSFAALPEEHKKHILALEQIIRGQRVSRDAVAEQLQALAASKVAQMAVNSVQADSAPEDAAAPSSLSADALMRRLSDLNLALAQSQTRVEALEAALKQEQEDVDMTERLSSRVQLEAHSGGAASSLYSGGLADTQTLPTSYHWAQVDAFVARVQELGEQVAELAAAAEAHQLHDFPSRASLLASIASDQQRVVLALAAKVSKLSAQVEHLKATGMDRLKQQHGSSRTFLNLFAHRRAPAAPEAIAVDATADAAAEEAPLVLNVTPGQQQQGQAQQTAGGFSFGAPAASTAAKSTGFSFGGGFGASAPAASTGFSFGAPAASSAAPSTGFSFGAPAASSAAAPSTGFSFGAPAAAPTAAASSGGFSFGAPAASAAAPSTGFSFGAPAATAAAPASTGFSFGAPATPTSSSSFSRSSGSNSKVRRK
jgi:hypothetical protein